MLTTKFWLIWPCSFREDFLEINQSETWIACGGHVCWRIRTKWAKFIEDLPWMLPTTFRFIWPSGFTGEVFLNRPIRNKNCQWWPCLLMDRDKMSSLYWEPSIYAAYEVSVHLAKRFQRRRLFRNQPIRNKNCLWWPYLLTDRHKMSNLYRRPSIDASYPVSVHLAMRFQRRFSEINQSETRIACGDHVC
jgi:hypothetical protein